MKKLILLLVSVSIFIACSNKDEVTTVEPEVKFKGEIAFSKSFGGSLEEHVTSAVGTKDGGTLILGYSNSSDGDVNKTHDLIDIWLTKVDSNGNKVWSKTIGGSSTDYGSSIIATSDGNYIIAGYSASNNGDIPGNVGMHDFFISKINENGDKIWAKNYGFTGHDHAHKIIQTKDGGYFVAGFAEYSGITGAGGGQDNGTGQHIGHRGTLHGSGEYLGVKLDSNGEFQWFRYYGGTQNDRVTDVVQCHDGCYVMVGYSESTNFDITDNKGSYDYWVVKISESGSVLWKKNFGGSGIDQAFAVAETADDSLMIVGKSNSSDKDVTKPLGGFDAWVILVDHHHGDLLWEKSFGGTEFDNVNAITNLANGNFAIAGNSRNSFDGKPSNGQNDFWIFEIDDQPTSKPLWQKTFGGSNIEDATALFQNKKNELIIVGESQSNDLDVASNKGGIDLWLLNLK